jgi:hypothetical protein
MGFIEGVELSLRNERAIFRFYRQLIGLQRILSPLDFLAEFTQHIPPKGSHLIRYYGWYSNKSRGMRKKAEAETSAASSSEETAAKVSSQSWAMLIKRVYEVDPLCCPECGGQMQSVARTRAEKSRMSWETAVQPIIASSLAWW